MMTLEKRISTYLAQNGATERLTFRQERRLRKAANRQAKAARRNLFTPESRPYVNAALSSVDTSETWPFKEETFGDFGPVPHPDDVVNGTAVACPTCGVFEGPCVTKSGKPAKASHKGRV
jgi:hypothetical protein